MFMFKQKDPISSRLSNICPRLPFNPPAKLTVTKKSYEWNVSGRKIEMVTTQQDHRPPIKDVKHINLVHLVLVYTTSVISVSVPL